MAYYHFNGRYCWRGRAYNIHRYVYKNRRTLRPNKIRHKIEQAGVRLNGNVANHFATEEKYMRQFKYPDYEGHRNEHLAFSNKATSLNTACLRYTEMRAWGCMIQSRAIEGRALLVRNKLAKMGSCRFIWVWLKR
jgi:hypothetical protein